MHLATSDSLLVVCSFPRTCSRTRRSTESPSKSSNAPALLKASTYTFVPGQPVYDKAVDALIIAAIDRELNARGVTKVDVGIL